MKWSIQSAQLGAIVVCSLRADGIKEPPRHLVGWTCGWTSSWQSPAYLRCDIKHVPSTLYLGLLGKKTKTNPPHPTHTREGISVNLHPQKLCMHYRMLSSRWLLSPTKSHHLHTVLTMEITATPTCSDTGGQHTVYTVCIWLGGGVIIGEKLAVGFSLWSLFCCKCLNVEEGHSWSCLTARMF